MFKGYFRWLCLFLVSTLLAGCPGDNTVQHDTIREGQSQVQAFSRLIMVANSGSSTISAFAYRDSDDSLIALPGSPYPTGRRPVDIAANSRVAVVLNQADSTLRSYRVDGSNLIQIGADVPTGGSDPTQLTLVANSNLLLVVNRGSSSLSIFRIAGDGQLTLLSSQVVLGAGAFDVVSERLLGPDENALVYVSQTNGVLGFRLNTTTGALAALSGFPVATGGASPRQLAYFTTGKGDRNHLAVTNFDSDTVSTFDVNPSSGTLSAPRVLPTGDGPSGLFEAPNTVGVTVLDRNDNTITRMPASLPLTTAAPEPSGGTLPSAGVGFLTSLSTQVECIAHSGSDFLTIRTQNSSNIVRTFNQPVGRAPEAVAQVFAPPGLRFVVQPVASTSGSAIAPPIQVEILDSLGFVVSSANGPVSLSILNNPGNASLSGTTTVNANSGLATFANVALSAPGDGYTAVSHCSPPSDSTGCA